MRYLNAVGTFRQLGGPFGHNTSYNGSQGILEGNQRTL